MYKLGERESKDYITRLLMSNLDYSSNRKARTLLDTWVKAGSRNLRKFAISHLRILSKRHIPEFYQWGIGLLVTQLNYHGLPSTQPSVTSAQRKRHSSSDAGEDDVALAAMSVLDEACTSDPTGRSVQTLIRKKPNFHVVGERANNLLTHILSTSSGVDYLNATNWIVPQMRKWYNGGGNRYYTNCLEKALVTSLNMGVGNNINNNNNNNKFDDNNKSKSTYIPRGTGYVGSFGGFGGFRHVNRRLRSPADDYYFDRIHHLPWQVELVVETSKLGGKKGVRKVKMITDVFTHTVPTTNEDEPLETYVVAVVMNQAGQCEPHAIFDGHGSIATIRARLMVGADADSDTVQTVSCTPEDRKHFSGEGSQIVSNDAIRWNFSVISATEIKESPSFELNYDRTDKTAQHYIGSAPVISNINESGNSLSHNPMYNQSSNNDNNNNNNNSKQNDGTVHLVSVWFKIPLPNQQITSVTLAPHLYGSLANTEEGCLMLRSSGHFDEFVNTIKCLATTTTTNTESLSKNIEDKKTPSSLDIRASLWAVAVIGGSNFGFELIQETDLMEFLTQQAIKCPMLSMRGILMYVLGVISCSNGGREALLKLGWQLGPHQAAGIVIPPKPDLLLKIEPTDNSKPMIYDDDADIGVRYVPLKSKDEKNNKSAPTSQALIILGHISNLGNGVTQKTSLQALRKLRTTHPKYFTSTKFLFAAMQLLSVYSFKIPARRFIFHDLFGRVKFTNESMKVFDQDRDTLDENELCELDDNDDE